MRFQSLLERAFRGLKRGREFGIRYQSTRPERVGAMRGVLRGLPVRPLPKKWVLIPGTGRDGDACGFPPSPGARVQRCPDRDSNIRGLQEIVYFSRCISTRLQLGPSSAPEVVRAPHRGRSIWPIRWWARPRFLRYSTVSKLRNPVNVWTECVSTEGGAISSQPPSTS